MIKQNLMFQELFYTIGKKTDTNYSYNSVLNMDKEKREELKGTRAGFAIGIVILARIFKYILYIFIVPVFILVIAVIVTAIFPDEKLDKSASEWLMPPKKIEPIRDNSFYYLMGFNAASEENPFDVGLKTSEAFEKAIREFKGDPENFSYNSYPDSKKIKPEKKIVTSYFQNKNLNIEKLSKNRIEAAKQVEKYNFLLKRYLNIRKFSNFQSDITMDINTPMPPFITYMFAHKLHLLDIWLKYSAGEKEKALIALIEDINFNWKMLSKADSLILKMVEYAIMERSLRLYSGFLDDPEIIEFIKRENLYEIPAPLTMEEINFRLVFTNEFRMIASGVKYITQVVESYSDSIVLEWILKKQLLVLYKKNANINYLYNRFKSEIELSEMSCRDFLEKNDNIREKMNKPPEAADYAYNAIGTILNQIANGDFSRYMLRGHRLAGLYRLVKIKEEIRKKGIKKSEIQSFIKSKQQKLQNSCTLRPVAWDDKNGELFFKTAEKLQSPGKKVERIAVPLSFPEKI